MIHILYLPSTRLNTCVELTISNILTLVTPHLYSAGEPLEVISSDTKLYITRVFPSSSVRILLGVDVVSSTSLSIYHTIMGGGAAFLTPHDIATGYIYKCGSILYFKSIKN